MIIKYFSPKLKTIDFQETEEKLVLSNSLD